MAVSRHEYVIYLHWHFHLFQSALVPPPPHRIPHRYDGNPYLPIDKLVVAARDPQAEQQWKMKWEQPSVCGLTAHDWA